MTIEALLFSMSYSLIISINLDSIYQWKASNGFMDWPRHILQQYPTPNHRMHTLLS